MTLITSPARCVEVRPRFDFHESERSRNLRNAREAASAALRAGGEYRTSIYSRCSELFAQDIAEDRRGRAGRVQWYTSPGTSPFGDVLTPLPESGIVDFTNPSAYAWWRDAHQPLFEAGVDVIKSDFGEQVPEDAVAFNGDSGRRLHNVYPLLYNRCVYEATRK